MATTRSLFGRRFRSQSPRASKTIGRVILDELGGTRFIVNTGATQIVVLGKGIQFGLPVRLTKGRINKVRIILTAPGEYNMEFFNVGRTEIRKVSSLDGLTLKQIPRAFARTTGL